MVPMDTTSHLIDCDTCPMREVRCDTCMVTAMLQPPSATLPLDAAEQAAVGRLVASGLVSAETAEGLSARREHLGLRRAVG